MHNVSTRVGVTARTLLVCVFSLGTHTALAASQCKGLDPAKWSADTAPEAKRCLASLEGFTAKECDRELCKAIEAWRDKDKPRDQKVTEVSGLLAKARDSIANNVVPTFREAQPLRMEMDRWLKEMAAATPEAMRSKSVGPFRTESVRRWAYNATEQVVLQDPANQIHLGQILDKGCDTPVSCERALRGSGEIVVHATMVQIIAGVLLQDLRDDAANHIEMLDKRWENYFSTSRFQYPWELLVNDRRYKTEGQVGFVSPPEDQVIFLHPSAGVRYNSKATGKFESALVLELLGMYRWRWEGTEPKNLLGGSLIMTWTNEPGERKPGWGAMMHFQKSYSVGVIRHSSAAGNRTSLLVSVDLAKLFENKDAVKKKLKDLAD